MDGRRNLDYPAKQLKAQSRRLLCFHYFPLFELLSSFRLS
jgi:hypothetical protein